MADFSFLSDTDESAVEEILAEAMDHCVLKQVAAINCSSFSDSVLPSDVESRFRRLKTFPSSSKSQTPLDSKTQLKGSTRSIRHQNPVSGDPSKVSERGSDSDAELKESARSTRHQSPISSGPGKVSEKGRRFEGKSRSGYVSSPSNSSSSSVGNVDPPKLKEKSVERKVKEGKSLSGPSSFHSNASDSPSETAKSGCFWCSPKRASKKRSGKRDVVARLGVDWGKHDEILSDLKSFSSKEQKKMMKKAMKEEEDINREAEKIVKWAKQASARLDFSVVDDELSDDDSGPNFGLH